jgi:hypothetical protein
MPTLTETLIQKDSVLLRAETNLKKALDQLEYQKRKLSEVQARALRNDDSVRPSQSLEAAQRREEIILLEGRVKEREAFLAEAKADQPRRDADRKRAADLTAKAQEIEAEAFKVSEKLKKLQDSAQDLGEAAGQTLALAEFTLNEIHQKETDRKKRVEIERNEKLGSLRQNLKTAQLELESAQRDKHSNQEIILERQKIRDTRQKNLDDFISAQEG